MAGMSEELMLQAAPLTALQLDLTQARLDTETMRGRLKEDRKEGRLRYDTRGAVDAIMPDMEPNM